MNFLIDTCVVSEFKNKNPEQAVINWLKSVEGSSLYLSVITIGELHKGIEKMKNSARKDMLQDWVENDLLVFFHGRIIEISQKISIAWGKIQAAAELKGRVLPSIDSMLVATAFAENLTIVTRNISDMRVDDVEIFNPWDYS